MKLSRCKHCREKFAPERPGQIVHKECIESYLVALREKARVKKEKEERAAIKVRKAKLKTRRDFIAEAQQVVNKYVRTRDAHKPCISCGARPEARFGGAADAGHFRSVGSAPHMRFYLPQIALQCVRCNRYLGGNAVEFRKGLVERLGLERVEQIEAMQGVAKWSIEYLQRLKRVISKKTRRLEKRA